MLYGPQNLKYLLSRLFCKANSWPRDEERRSKHWAVGLSNIQVRESKRTQKTIRRSSSNKAGRQLLFFTLGSFTSRTESAWTLMDVRLMNKYSNGINKKIRNIFAFQSTNTSIQVYDKGIWSYHEVFREKHNILSLCMGKMKAASSDWRCQVLI